MNSWYDYGPAETLELFNALQKESASARARNNQFVIITPGTHCSYAQATERTIVGERDLGDARLDVLGLQLRWFDYWLKGIGNGITEMPRVQYYLMGKNRRQSAVAWPIPGTRFEKLYLVSHGRANSRRGDGTLSFEPPAGHTSDRFIYDPASPVPSLGGHSCCTGTDTESGSYDQSRIEMRRDVLVYTSAMLNEGLEVTGPLEVILRVSSSAKEPTSRPSWWTCIRTDGPSMCRKARCACATGKASTWSCACAPARSIGSAWICTSRATISVRVIGSGWKSPAPIFHVETVT